MNLSSTAGTTAAVAAARFLLEHEVGFDYAQTVRELNQLLSHEQIASVCGYNSRRSVINLMGGKTTPSHTHGEALYILYVETFNRKPPAKQCIALHNTASPST